MDKHWRGRGFGRILLQAIMHEPQLQGVTMLLHTNDAHSFYEQLGFYKPSMPERQMLRRLETRIARTA